MCGRYTFTPNDKFYDRFEIENRLDELKDRYNVAPGQEMPVITKNSPNQISLMNWGLIPSWAKDKNITYRTINARAESVDTKPSFKRAFSIQRCLIPASGFYEWQKISGKKNPHYFYLKNKQEFSFAGLYDIWKNEVGESITTYTIITTEANDLVGQIHDRMPVILNQIDENTWLDKDTNPQVLLSLLKPFPNNLMSSHPVSDQINKTDIDDKNLIKPITTTQDSLF